jgi:hypothetical protein
MSNILYVAVRNENGVAKIELEPITLNASVDYVVWWCDPLAGQILTIDFPQGSPFLSLRQEGPLVIGSGNTGAVDLYPYELKISNPPEMDCSGTGEVDNRVEQKITVCPIHCQASGGPPGCTTDPTPGYRDLDKQGGGEENLVNPLPGY